MPVPESSMSEVKPTGGFSANRPRGIPVYIGCAADGPTTPKSFGARRQAEIAALYKAGPLARAAAYCASQAPSQCLCIRVPPTARAASKSAVTLARNALSDFTYVLSGTPTDGADVKIVFTVGGSTGTGGIFYKVSLDGGVSFAAPVALLTATSITVLGVALALGSTKVVTAADSVAWFQRLGSASVGPVTETKAGSSTAAYDVEADGTIVDAYRFRLEWLQGGTLGTPGATYRYCMDWDGFTGTWSRETALGDATQIHPLDHGQTSGLQVTISTGSATIDAGDVVSFRTTAPEPAWADILAALTDLRGRSLLWSFLAIFAPMSATDAGSLDTLLEGWASKRRTFAEIETRDRETTETISAWAARVKEDYAGFTSTRVWPSAGHAPAADPITGRRDRRSATVDYVTRDILVPQISTDPAQVTLGPLPASRTLYDPSGLQVEYDADKDPILFDAHGYGSGFRVLRTFADDEQLVGTYPAGGIIMGPAGDMGLGQLRRVLDALEDALQSQAALELVSKFRRWTAVQAAQSKGKYKAGDIREEDARGIERRLRIAGANAILGDASGVTVVLDRTPVSLGGGKFELGYSGQCSPMGYVYKFSGKVGLVDPAYEA